MGAAGHMREAINGVSGSTDAVPWWVKAAFYFGAPTVFAGYLIYSLVNGIVPTLLAMQNTMSNLVVAVNTISQEHVAAKQQNDQILRVLRASCVNAASTLTDRERCFE